MLAGSLASTALPNGVEASLLGGVLIGHGTALVYDTTGIVPGASTVIESTLSSVSGLHRFRRFAGSRRWHGLFALGTVGGAGGTATAAD